MAYIARKEEGRFRIWNEGKGAYFLENKTYYYVFAEGDDDIVACSENPIVAEHLAVVLNGLPGELAKEMIASVARRAISRELSRSLPPPVPSDPNRRHSIAS